VGEEREAQAAETFCPLGDRIHGTKIRKKVRDAGVGNFKLRSHGRCGKRSVKIRRTYVIGGIASKGGGLSGEQEIKVSGNLYLGEKKSLGKEGCSKC